MVSAARRGTRLSNVGSGSWSRKSGVMNELSVDQPYSAATGASRNRKAMTTAVRPGMQSVLLCLAVASLAHAATWSLPGCPGGSKDWRDAEVPVPGESDVVCEVMAPPMTDRDGWLVRPWTVDPRSIMGITVKAGQCARELVAHDRAVDQARFLGLPGGPGGPTSSSSHLAQKQANLVGRLCYLLGVCATGRRFRPPGADSR